MQYERPQVSKLTIRSDFPTGISSSVYGANIDAVGFNIGFIAERQPQLAVDLVRLWQEARELTSDMPAAAEEDQLAAQSRLQQLFARR